MKVDLRTAGNGLLAISLAGLTGWGLVNWSPLEEAAQSAQSGPQSGDVYSVVVDTSELRLTCPPGITDPLNPERVVQEESVWVSTGAATSALTGSGVSIDSGQVSSAADFPAAISAAGSTERDHRFLDVDACQLPSSKLALVGGATTVGEDAVLTVANPGAKPVQVTVAAFGAGGALEQLPLPLTIPANSSVKWLPAAWFPDQERLALVLSADGEGVAAWLQSSGRDGEVPLGLTRLGARPLATQAVFPGVSEALGHPVLRLLNPGDKAQDVEVATSTKNGLEILPGTENYTVDPRSVFQVDLAGIGTDPSAVVVRAAEPIAASVSFQIEGKADPIVGTKSVWARTLASGASATTSIAVPSTEELNGLVQASDLTGLEVTLAVTNASDRAATVEGISIAPGETKTWPGSELDSIGGQLNADVPVFASLYVTGEASLGKVAAVAGLGFGGVESITRTVTLVP